PDRLWFAEPESWRARVIGHCWTIPPGLVKPLPFGVSIRCPVSLLVRFYPRLAAFRKRFLLFTPIGLASPPAPRMHPSRDSAPCPDPASGLHGEHRPRMGLPPRSPLGRLGRGPRTSSWPWPTSRLTVNS